MEERIINNETEVSGAELTINIDFDAILRTLKKRWKFILYCTLAAGVLGCLIAIGIPRQFKVVAKVAPELSLRSNSLTSLASLTGVGMSSMLSGNNDAILPSVYPDIIESTPFLVDILNSKVTADSTLISYMRYDMPSFWLNNVIHFPSAVVGHITELFASDETEESEAGIEGIDPYRLTHEQSTYCTLLKNSINVDVNKKNFLVTITVTLPDKEIAATVSRLLVDNLKNYVTNYRIQKAVQNAEYLAVVTEDAHQKYLNSQKEYATYLDRNQNVFLKSNMIRAVDYQNQVNLDYQLYSSLESELQQAQTRVLQETPVFAEIVPPAVPTKSANSRKKIAMIFALLGFFAACAYVVINDKIDSKRGTES